MNVLFVMRHSGYLRNFESTVRLLCDRGHAVRLAFPVPGHHTVLDPLDVAQELERIYPKFARVTMPSREDAWGYAARDLRIGADYLRYLTPAFRNAPKLVDRARREAPRAIVRRAAHGPLSTRAGRALLLRGVRAVERAVPTDPRIDAFLEANRPDVLVVTPLIEPGAPQAEYVRSARALGIRTALCVASWDNLTNKGLIHGDVDLVTVWNDMMKREAVELHGVPARRIAVTGAQPFDHWFTWQPATTRDEFCAKVGLPAERPYVLYLCSSRFIAPEEVPFVKRWVQALRRSSSPLLRDAGVLVRPHPQNADQWEQADLTEWGGAVTIWPPEGEAPADARSRADYFDSIYHSAAVVGVNTTAEIESAIIGRSVYTVLAPEFRETQDGTLHFDHLRRVNGGLLHEAFSLEEHVRQLEQGVRDGTANGVRCRRFVKAFVRPYGLDTPATPRVVDALETLASTSAAAPARTPVWAPLVQPSLVRYGAELQRQALITAETKGARRAAKARRAAAGRPRADVPRPWRELVAAYRDLDHQHRTFFARTIADAVPGEVLPLILEHARPERLDYPHAEIFVRVTSRAERNRLRSCAKEPFTIEWIHRCIGAGDVLYDIGANIGAYSLVAAKKPGGGARVFAFEPAYANWAALCANVVINKAGDQITPLPVALSNADTLRVFSLRGLEPGTARHAFGDLEAGEGPTLYRQPVLTFRLDDAIERFGLPMPNHIKLDVDGGELAVLEGAPRALASPSLRSMLVEVSSELAEPVTKVLTGHGMRLQEKVNVENTAGEFRVWYGLFTRQEQDAPVHEAQFKFIAR